MSFTKLMQKTLYLLTAAVIIMAGEVSQANTRAVTYGAVPVSETTQVFSISKPAGMINASDLRPEKTGMKPQFQYAYRFLLDLGESLPDLGFKYDDRHGDGPVGAGWKMNLCLDIQGGMDIDFMSPVLIPYKTRNRWYLLADTEDIPVLQSFEQGKVVFTFPSAQGRNIVRFLQIKDISGREVAVPFEILSGEWLQARFEYALQGSRILPRKIRLPSGVLNFEYCAGSGKNNGTGPGKFDDEPVRLSQIVFIPLVSEKKGHGARWILNYKPAIREKIIFLVKISFETSGRTGRILEFDYHALEAPERATSLETMPRHGMWKRIQNDPRWILPDRLSIATSPGLRFTKLNQDMHWDLVNTQDRKLNAWLWDPQENTWKNISSIYLPHRSSVKFTSPVRPTGSHYNGLVKTYRDSHKNTYRFQSFVVSYYEPGPDLKQLAYTSYVCFPEVYGGILHPDESGTIWDCDSHPLLHLPVPLQYEGRPWPRHLPGIATVERYDNQGAQFVDFTKNGRMNLLYIGLRYRDVATGKLLLADLAVHRDTGNCTRLYRTTWEHLGKKREVQVEVCQGFWDTRETVWKEDYPLHHNKSFWRRKDLGPDGKPTGRFVLPWHPDPTYFHHLIGFRNLRFVRLDRDQNHAVHAVVYGRKGSGFDPEHTFPAAKDIYVLRKGYWRWEHLPVSSGLYPPDEFFSGDTGQFADLNNDGMDDAIIGTGSDSSRRAWMNSTDPQNRWKDVPAYHLPREVDLKNGSAVLHDLDNDGDLDIILERGHIVYLNQTSEGSGTPSFSMTWFTDENNRKKSVKSCLN